MKHILPILLLTCATTAPVGIEKWSKYDHNNCSCKWKYMETNGFINYHVFVQNNTLGQGNNHEDSPGIEQENSSFQDAQKLRFQNCSIATINITAFKGLRPIITELDLSRNNIKHLRKDMFKEISRLRIIDLSSNNITILEDEVFFNFKSLWRIVLNNNKIEKITENTFKNLPALMHLDLAYNQLKTISFDLTEYISKLNSLDLQGNPWKCDCHLEKFKQSCLHKYLLSTPIECKEPQLLKDFQWADTITFSCPPFVIDVDVQNGTEKNVTLACKVSGDPEVKIQWSRPPFDNITKNTEKYKISSEVVGEIKRVHLTIVNVDYKDIGNYKCIATNSESEEDGKYLMLTYATVQKLDRVDCSPCSCTPRNMSKSIIAICKDKNLSEIPSNLSQYINETDFSNNFFSKLGSDAIAGTKLAKIQFHNCTIAEIDVNAFIGQARLIELYLSNNKITNLHPGVFFNKTPHLKIIDISYNEITKLQDGTFHDLIFLQEIILNHNKIEQITEETFKELPDLEYIDLSDNHLKTASLANSLPKLNRIDLQDNPWVCDCNLESFRRIVVNKKLTTSPLCEEPDEWKGRSWNTTSFESTSQTCHKNRDDDSNITVVVVVAVLVLVALLIKCFCFLIRNKGSWSAWFKQTTRVENENADNTETEILQEQAPDTQTS